MRLTLALLLLAATPAFAQQQPVAPTPDGPTRSFTGSDLFGLIPLTTFEYDELGNPAQKASYDYMLSYSPYDNVRAKAYPALYVGTGLWDS